MTKNMTKKNKIKKYKGAMCCMQTHGYYQEQYNMKVQRLANKIYQQTQKRNDSGRGGY